MIKGYKRIKILSEAEIEDLYALPKFTLSERKLFFSLDKKEIKLIESIPDIPSKIYTILQLGYFKAKNILFNFKFEEITRDVHFVINSYFPEQRKSKTILLKAKKVLADEQILEILGWVKFDSRRKAEVLEYAITISRIHANHIDIFREVLSFFENNKITLPGYTVLQDIISFAVNSEYIRLENIIKNNISPALSELLSNFKDMTEVKKNRLNKTFDLLKHEQKNFRTNQLQLESAKSLIYSRYYNTIKSLILKLEISAKCVSYYAAMFDTFSADRVENFETHFRHLCLICSIYHNRQIMQDNAITSFIYHNNSFTKGSVTYINENFSNIANIMR